MKSQIDFALAHPAFDPVRDFHPGHFWQSGPLSFGLTVNIGLE